MISTARLHRGSTGACLALTALLTFSAAPASADIQIVYATEDLPNVVADQDLWRYTYTVSGRAFDQGYGFNIYYPSDSFGAITLVEAPLDDWDPVEALSPEETLNLPGLLVAQAKRDLPVGSARFIVDVIWFGVAAPGSQRYELFDTEFTPLDPPGTLGTVAQVVPEPQAGLLVLTGLALLAAVVRRRAAPALA